LREAPIDVPVCVAIPTLTISLGSTDTLNYNTDCAYANDFPSR